MLHIYNKFQVKAMLLDLLLQVSAIFFSKSHSFAGSFYPRDTPQGWFILDLMVISIDIVLFLVEELSGGWRSARFLRPKKLGFLESEDARGWLL